MTTSWALVTRGRPVEAFKTHASGTLLAIVALVTGLGATIVAARGRRLSWQPTEATVAVMAVVLAGVVIVEWILRLLVR